MILCNFLTYKTLFKDIKRSRNQEKQNHTKRPKNFFLKGNTNKYINNSTKQQFRKKTDIHTMTGPASKYREFHIRQDQLIQIKYYIFAKTHKIDISFRKLTDIHHFNGEDEK